MNKKEPAGYAAAAAAAAHAAATAGGSPRVVSADTIIADVEAGRIDPESLPDEQYEQMTDEDKAKLKAWRLKRLEASEREGAQ